MFADDAKVDAAAAATAGDVTTMLIAGMLLVMIAVRPHVN